jgi:type III secretory pathway component EscT
LQYRSEKFIGWLIRRIVQPELWSELMPSVDLTLISFILAMLLGAMSLFLIRRTADEYERAILNEPVTRLVLPTFGSLAAIALLAIILFG